jgi:hypothetical protein
MLTSEIEKQNQSKKKITSARVNLPNLLLRSWDRNNPIKNKSKKSTKPN